MIACASKRAPAIAINSGTACIPQVDMAHIGGERHHSVVDIRAGLLPQHQASADEGVPEVVNAYVPMAAAGNDPQLGRKAKKYSSDFAIPKHHPCLLGHEERRGDIH